MCLVICVLSFFFFFKQKTAYEMRISDWSSDVCSSDLKNLAHLAYPAPMATGDRGNRRQASITAPSRAVPNRFSVWSIWPRAHVDPLKRLFIGGALIHYQRLD